MKRQVTTLSIDRRHQTLVMPSSFFGKNIGNMPFLTDPDGVLNNVLGYRAARKTMPAEIRLDSSKIGVEVSKTWIIVQNLGYNVKALYFPHKPAPAVDNLRSGYHVSTTGLA